MSDLDVSVDSGGRPACHSGFLAVAVGTVLLLASSAASAQEVLNPQPWTVETYGVVSTMGRVGNTLYVGGNFEMVGPSTGQGVPVSPDEGRPRPGYPRVAGVVFAVVADGEGGWFIGGDFVGVGGLPRRNLAHIRADGRVSSWAPDPDVMVRTLVLREDRLYVGGDFTTMAGVTRRGAAAFVIADGRSADPSPIVDRSEDSRRPPDCPRPGFTERIRITPWNPDAPPNAYGGVYAMVVHGHSVYLGGSFKSVGGQPRNRLAEVDARSGRVSDWGPGADSEILALAVHGNTVYAGGYFLRVGGQYHPLLVALDRATGVPLPWRWKLERTPDWYRYDSGPYVGVLVVHGHTLYVGGSFTHVDGLPRGGVAALDLRTHAVTEWNAHLVNYDGPSPYCFALAVHGGVVYVGGRFVRMGAVQRLYVGAVDAETGEPLPWYPKPNGRVQALAVGEGAIYVGGEFSSLWSWQWRTCLAAIDVRTGEPLPWDPNPNGPVTHLVVSGQTVYVAGDFSQVGGQARQQIAALDGVTGEPTAWNPGVSGYTSRAVWAMVLTRGTLYVGGWFYAVGGQPRANLAAIDSASGLVTDWNPGADDEVLALALRGDTLYAGGFFYQIGGASRRLLAALDAKSGTVLPWHAEPNGHIEDLAVGDRALYVGGTLSNVGGVPRKGLAALDLATGALLPWRADATDRVLRVAVSGGVVYAGGWFNSVGGQERYGAAAMDGETGAVLSWNPQLRAEDMATKAVVWSLLPWGNTIYLGGSFRGVGLTPCTGLAWLRDAGTYAQPQRVAEPLATAASWRLRAEVSPNPVRSSAVIHYTLASRAAVSLAVYDLQGRRVATLQDHELLSAGEHQAPVRTEGWPAGYYFCRLEASGESTTRKLLVVR